MTAAAAGLELHRLAAMVTLLDTAGATVQGMAVMAATEDMAARMARRRPGTLRTTAAEMRPVTTSCAPCKLLWASSALQVRVLALTIMAKDMHLWPDNSTAVAAQVHLRAAAST